MTTTIDSFDSLKNELINKWLSPEVRNQLDNLRNEVNLNQYKWLNFTDAELREFVASLNNASDYNSRRLIFKNVINRETWEKIDTFKSEIETKKLNESNFDIEKSREMIDYMNNLDSTYVSHKYVILSTLIWYARSRGYSILLDSNWNITTTGNTYRQSEVQNLFRNFSDKEILKQVINQNTLPEERVKYINNETFDRLQEKLNILSNSVSNYYNDNQDLKNQIKELNSKISDLKNNLSTFTNDWDIARTFYAWIDWSIQDLWKKIDSLNKEIQNSKETSNNDISNLQSQIVSLTSEVNSLKSQINSPKYVADEVATTTQKFTQETWTNSVSTETFTESADRNIKSFIRDPFAAVGEVITSHHPITWLAVIWWIFYAAFINKDMRSKFWKWILLWTWANTMWYTDKLADSFGSFNGDKKELSSAVVKNDWSVQLENWLVLSPANWTDPYKQWDYWVDPATGNLYDDKWNQVDSNGSIITDSSEVTVGETKKDKIKSKIWAECKDFEKNYSFLENSLSFNNDNIADLWIANGKIVDQTKLTAFYKKNNLDVYYLQNKNDLDKIMIELVSSKDTTDTKVWDIFIDWSIDWAQTEKNLEELNQLIVSGASDFYILSRAVSIWFIPKTNDTVLFKDWKFSLSFKKWEKIKSLKELWKYFLNWSFITNKDLASPLHRNLGLLNNQHFNNTIQVEVDKINRLNKILEKAIPLRTKETPEIMSFYKKQVDLLNEAKAWDLRTKLLKLQEYNNISSSTLWKVPVIDDNLANWMKEYNRLREWKLKINDKIVFNQWDWVTKSIVVKKINWDKLECSYSYLENWKRIDNNITLKSKWNWTFVAEWSLKIWWAKKKIFSEIKLENIESFNSNSSIHKIWNYINELWNFVKSNWNNIDRIVSLSDELNRDATIKLNLENSLNKKIEWKIKEIEKDIANSDPEKVKKRVELLDKKITDIDSKIKSINSEYEWKIKSVKTDIEKHNLRKEWIEKISPLNDTSFKLRGQAASELKYFVDCGDLKSLQEIASKYKTIKTIIDVNWWNITSFVSKASKIERAIDEKWWKYLKWIAIPIMAFSIAGAFWKWWTDSWRMVADMWIWMLPVAWWAHDLYILKNPDSWYSKIFLWDRKMDQTEKNARLAFGVIWLIPWAWILKLFKAEKAIKIADNVLEVWRIAWSVATYTFLWVSMYQTAIEMGSWATPNESLENADYIESTDVE